MTLSTRDRLLDAALSLFAADGFAGTSVGDIEKAAGFVKRGGTLYKHFSSKPEVLAALIERHAAAIGGAGQLADLLPLGELRAELTLVARFALAELDAEEQIHRVLDKEGHRAAAARDRMLEEVLEPGYRGLADLFRRWLGDHAEDVDADALVTILVGGLVNLRRNRWTFGRVPLGVDDERAIATWVNVAVAAIRAAGRLNDAQETR